MKIYIFRKALLWSFQVQNVRALPVQDLYAESLVPISYEVKSVGTASGGNTLSACLHSVSYIILISFFNYVSYM